MSIFNKNSDERWIFEQLTKHRDHQDELAKSLENLSKTVDSLDARTERLQNKIESLPTMVWTDKILGLGSLLLIIAIATLLYTHINSMFESRDKYFYRLEMRINELVTRNGDTDVRP